MFLLFVVIVVVICWFAHQIKMYNFDRERRERAKREGKTKYIDRDGNWVDTETNVAFKVDNGIRLSGKGAKDLFEFGDIRYVSLSGKEIRNFSQEWRDKRAR